MKYFFRQAEDVRLEPQVSAEVYFRGANATGLIEKHLGAKRVAVLFFVNGEPGTAYLIGEEKGKSIPRAEFFALREETVRIINLPSVAGRLTLLALESQVGRIFSNMDNEAWKWQVAQWKQDEWSGLVEIKAEKLHGFAFFWRGELQKSDLTFSTSQGFISDLPKLDDIDDDGFEVVSYSHATLPQSYQCTVLRQAATHWSRAILSRYQEMVGQKLLQMMDRELNRQIKPWQWNIVLDGKEMLDSHFFPYLMDAALAYRALFMAMGAQMDFVIGNHLTQKLLNETFEQVYPDERVVLQAQRLVPAAFSE
jgi:hypothetical protein